MKKAAFTILFLMIAVFSMACPVCERNQPAVLKGISHGTGPETKWDYIAIWTTTAIVLYTLYYSVKWLISPGEKSENHIKRVILNNE
ncbi:MAG: hypothetical protein KIT80_19075 [Chitinophagaceae bacterium]|nr:hypothetical protein [Chitinophagaceae bacterium]MCW5929030.1 hypothetical protein [Chitinophagaceae bacterium]